jgi:hypothetical protein
VEPVPHPYEVRPTLARVPSNNPSSARKLFQCSALGVLFALTAVSLAGCGIFDPKQSKKPPIEPPAVYVIPFLPGNVLHNLEIAYSRRDTTAYKNLYDSSYVGVSENLNDPPGTVPLSFTYSDEVAHITKLASVPTISSVTFELGPETSWNRLESDDPSHPDWAVIQIAGSSLDIQITEGVNTLQASGSNEFFQFSFQPTTPAASPTDTLWNIVKWRETVGP